MMCQMMDRVDNVIHIINKHTTSSEKEGSQKNPLTF